jgi:hypothetical protein
MVEMGFTLQELEKVEVGLFDGKRKLRPSSSSTANGPNLSFFRWPYYKTMTPLSLLLWIRSRKEQG